MARAKALKFTGRYDASGQPDRWFSGIPARNLDAAEVKGLSDEEYANATGGADPLYVADESTPKTPAPRPTAGGGAGQAAAPAPTPTP